MSLTTEESKEFKVEFMGYNIVRAENRPGLYEVKTQVGVRPKALSGLYTNPRYAQTDIKNYLNRKNAKKEST